ncbi:MAG: hypothetical protein ACC742_02605 [Thermoanaerobaculales bacterium]
MSRFRIFSVVVALFLVAAIGSAGGYVVILKSGHKLRCKEPMRIEGSNAIITLSTGTMTSYPLHLVDLVETERYNQQGLGSALLIEELTLRGTPIPTPTPRKSLGQHASITSGNSSELGTTISPTPTPTPGIQLQSIPYHDQRIDKAFSKIFDQKGLYIYRTSQGTQPDYFFVQTPTDSEREVFKALEIVAEAFVLIYGLHEEIAPDAVELEMIQTSGKAAGTFRMNREQARQLAGGDVPVQQFYIKNVIF